MALTDIQVRNLKPKAKLYRVADRDSLCIEVPPRGAKAWRFRCRVGKKASKAAKLVTFEHVALAWYETHAPKTDQSGTPTTSKAKAWSASYAKKTLGRLKGKLFPYLGRRPIADITTPELIETLKKSESEGLHETANRLLTLCNQVFRFAAQSGIIKHNPARECKGALTRSKPKHMAAVVDPAQLAPMLRAMGGYAGTDTVRVALALTPLLFVRPGELRHAKWEDINLETAEWRFLASKTDTPHIVPLSTQALALFRELLPHAPSYSEDGKPSGYVFRGARDRSRPMSENTVNAALRAIGIAQAQQCAHGFRATARTIIAEVLNVRPDLIEHQLAHEVKDALGTAYNRTSFLPERKTMMQNWADYLDSLKAGGNVIPFTARQA